MKGEMPLKCCPRPECFMVLVSAVRYCHACGHDFRDPRTAWDRHDAKSRSITYQGVMYVAYRPDRSSLWKIRDGSTLEDIADKLTTRDVTAYFKKQGDRETAAALAEWGRWQKNSAA
ncbi:hypothetical protein ACC862_24150 [Rhizobium ruizarguesonis]